MERNEAGQSRSLRPGTKNHHPTILTQLLQIIERMEHIDDVFLWLANQMMPQLSLDALQIWTVQVTQSQQFLQSLRAASLSDKTIPQHVVINSNIAETVTAIARRQKNIPERAVDDIFSYHHANLLKRYGLYYYAGCFLSSSIPIPLPKSQKLMVPAKAPSAIITLVFLKQPDSHHLVSNINLLLEQALLIAERHGLLPIPSVNEPSPLLNTPPLSLPDLYDLIPRRTQSNTSMRSSSPFSSTAPISNKIALTFYGAIDGTKTIVEIAVAKKMSAKEITAALQILLQEKRMQLYTKEGQLVDSEMLLRSI